jgi:hypothetical protein
MRAAIARGLGGLGEERYRMPIHKTIAIVGSIVRREASGT